MVKGLGKYKFNTERHLYIDICLPSNTKSIFTSFMVRFVAKVVNVAG